MMVAMVMITVKQLTVMMVMMVTMVMIAVKLTVMMVGDGWREEK
jgi:hypothetical protein